MFHPPSSEKGRNDNDQCHDTHHLQKAKAEFLDHWLRDVFALIVHKIKIHHFHSRVNLNIAEHFNRRAWVNRSERLQGEPLGQKALTFQTPAGIHFG